MIELKAPDVECTVYTAKAGALSALGHDLELVAERATLALAENLSELTLTVDAGSLRVHSGGSEGDRKEIEENTRKTVLASAKFPSIRYVARSIERREDVYRVSGELELHGVRRAVAADVVRRGEEWRTEVVVHQPDFGIKPFSAMFGALRIQPDVRVVVKVSTHALKIP